MKIIQQEDAIAYNIILKENNKYIGIYYGGNGDLYWFIRTNDEDYSFTITQENSKLYELFEQLFIDIDNINLYTEDEFYTKEEIEENKKKYREQNYSNYNELYNKETNTITWYSDETAHDAANILKIVKDEDEFKINFSTQPDKDEYDTDFHSKGYISIRFRNSGSSYKPFNIFFMRMYNNMKSVDDVNDHGHQITIDEYLYNKSRVKKLIK